jgi:GNAT superfamily N-acetyltransferase
VTSASNRPPQREHRVTLTPVPAAAFPSAAAEIERTLRASLEEANEQSTNTLFAFEARADGPRIGGVVASTSHGWLLLKMLWVDRAWRRVGVGARLMAAVEEKAREIGCHVAWLDTSNAEAHAFYLRLGYTVFGMLENEGGDVPAGHMCWFMRKRLPAK